VLGASGGYCQMEGPAMKKVRAYPELGLAGAVYQVPRMCCGPDLPGGSAAGGIVCVPSPHWRQTGLSPDPRVTPTAAAARPYTPFRPFSIARQMVSVMDALSALALRRIASRSALGGRNAMSGVTPVAGRPLFFCKTVIDLAI
jgi:hypothetical protein